MLTPRKPDAERARPNKYASKEQKVQEELPAWDGLVRGPDLPDNIAWSEETVKWWDIWRKSPQAMLCSETDWQGMLVGARIHQRMHSPDWSGKYPSNTAYVNLSAELRRIVGSIGSSYEDRKSLGINLRSEADAYNEVTPEIDAAVEVAVDYVSRMAARQRQAKSNGTS